jgi:hypothetical protein
MSGCGLFARVALLMGLLVGSTTAAHALILVPLTLINGWTGGPMGTHAPAVSLSGTTVRFQGAIAGGSNSEPFKLDSMYRPQFTIILPVDMCNGHKGRIIIETNGDTTLQAEKDFSDAQCFTSLDGLSYVTASTGFKPYPVLLNYWTSGAGGTSPLRAHKSGSLIRFEGHIEGGLNAINPVAQFPVSFSPPEVITIAVDMCNATNGRVVITPAGYVSVVAESDFSYAQCGTSLDGAFFTLNMIGFTTAGPLLNGWEGVTDHWTPGVKKISGVVTFQGAIWNGSNHAVFVLPKAMRPKADVYLNVDTYNSTKGTLHIQTDGTVNVANDDLTNASQFTSLDGVSFIP